MCDGEGKYHGYHPYMKGLEGVIVPSLSHVPAPTGHPWRVVYITPNQQRPGWGYFKASELDLIQEATP